MSEASKAVFLSYASQDAEAARKICDALRAAGVEVWFDQNELVGGDAWDQKIRKQIKECTLLIPIISAATQARTEGYFRLEWRLADQRTHLMGKSKAFLLPVTIDGTTDAEADVPDSFVAVQWTKAPGGAVPAAFVARVQQLLNGGAAPPTADQAPGSAPSLSVPVRRPSRSRWLWPVLGAGGLAVVAVVVFRLVGSRPPNAVLVAPANPAVAGETSAVRELLATAWTKMGQIETGRAQLEVANGLCQRATESEPNNADAWAAWSQVDSWFVYHGFDESSVHREGARVKAAHALQLAPGAVEARLAQACYLVRSAGGLIGSRSVFEADAEKLLEALLRERPAEPRALLALGILLRNEGRTADARATLEKLAAQPAHAALAWNEMAWMAYAAMDYRAAEAALDRSLALQPAWPNLMLAAQLALLWRGDLGAARAAIDRIPPEVRQEDPLVALACNVAWCRREPERLLNELEAMPRDWINSNTFRGPKSLWAARAHEMAGHQESARAQWEKALRQIEPQLVQQPDSGDLLEWKVECLAKLGRTAEAERTLQLAAESGSRLKSYHTPWNQAVDLLLLGRDDEAMRVVASLDFAVAAFKSYPPLDRLRDRPDYKAFIARLAADPRFSPDAPAGPVAAAPDAKSVAVLAFANLSDDKGNEYFSDGISEELLNVLAKVPGLKVSARTSAFYFKGKEVPVPEIARQLGVAYVVEGSVRKSGDKVRITAQLIKAADGFHVWSDTFTRDLKDIFAVQDEIAGLIAKNLELKMGMTPADAHREVNPEAHQLVLEGWHHLAQRTAAGFDRAEQAFNAALKLDPQFAVAHSGLANVSALRGRYRLLAGEVGSSDFTALALAQGRLALQLDPSLAEAHAAMGSALTDNRQFAEAEEEFQKAFAVNPSYGVAYHWYCHVVAARGRLDLALQQTDRSVALDPYSFIAHFIRVAYATDARRFAAALAEADRAAALRADVFLPLEAERIRCLVGLERRGEALAAARRVLQDPNLLVTGWWCAGDALCALRQCGAVAEAAAVGAELLKKIRGDNYIRGYILCALGRFDEGIPALNTAPAILQGRMSWIPMFDPVRDTPAFRQLLVRLNCVEEDKVARETLARMLQEQETKP